MSKLGNPFGGNKTVYITQTYHSGGGNIAIDCITGNTNSQTPIYAISDGLVIATTPAGNSYLCKTVDGADFKEFYVHTARWTVKAGDRVKAGEQIGYIASPDENGGYGMHLHMGLTVGNYIMDYFGRGINFRTTYQDIANDWFNGSINNPINWSLFKDLSFNNGNMFSNGDRIIFTGEQNIRVGSGLKYRVESSTYAGMKATIIGDSRVADGYTWYDIQVDGGGTGWVADVNKFVKLTDENTNNNDGSGNIPPSMDDVQSLKQELEQLRKLVDEGKEAYSNLTKEKEELVKELDHAKVCNADLLAHSKEVTEENDKLRQDLAKYQKTVLDLEEKLSGHQVIDGYSTTELLREIVKRIFTPGDN